MLCLHSYAIAGLEYLSIAENAVVMYNAPSKKADKFEEESNEQ